MLVTEKAYFGGGSSWNEGEIQLVDQTDTEYPTWQKTGSRLFVGKTGLDLQNAWKPLGLKYHGFISWAEILDMIAEKYPGGFDERHEAYGKAQTAWDRKTKEAKISRVARLLETHPPLFKEGRKVLIGGREGTYTGRCYVESPDMAPPYGSKVKHVVNFGTHTNAYEEDQIKPAPNPYQDDNPYQD